MVYLKLLLTALCWGGTFVAGRDIGNYLNPYAAAFLRFLLSSICLLWVVKRHEGGLPRLDRTQWLPVLFLGLSGVFAYNILFFQGLTSVPAGRAAVIIAINPIVIGLLSAVFFKEKLGALKLMGILLSVNGAILVITKGHPLEIFKGNVSVGELCILGCVASWVTYSLVGKFTMKKLSPHVAVTYSCLVGTPLLAIPAFAHGMVGQVLAAPPIVWLEIIYLGVLATVIGFTWYYEGVNSIGASRAAVFINFVPISAIIAGYLLLNEPVGMYLAVGAGMVVCGVFLTNKAALHKK